MKIPEYLQEMRHAVETVVTEIYREQHEVERLREQLAALEAAANDGYQRAAFLAANPELDDDGLGTAIHWDTYFGADKERYYKNADVADAIARVAAHEFSVTALCSSLLQYGKQGLSLHFGKKRTGCPDGRLVAGLTLHEVIWQARNQGLHWEDGAFHEPTSKCFEQLAKDLDPVFAQYKQRSMAFEVIKHLGWKSAEDFFRDMRSFAT